MKGFKSIAAAIFQQFMNPKKFNIVMNRSLVPPVFFERGNNVKISPNHHIDMYELSKLGSQVENKCEHILHV